MKPRCIGLPQCGTISPSPASCRTSVLGQNASLARYCCERHGRNGDSPQGWSFRKASVNEPHAYGRSLLLEACIEGHAAAVCVLLENGADPHQRTRALGVTATQFCALLGHADCLSALLAWFRDRSDLPYREQRGASGDEYLNVAPIHLAASSGCIECVILICDFSSNTIMVPSEYLLLINPEGVFSAVSVFGRETESPIEAASICRQQGVETSC